MRYSELNVKLKGPYLGAGRAMAFGTLPASLGLVEIAQGAFCDTLRTANAWQRVRRLRSRCELRL